MDTCHMLCYRRRLREPVEPVGGFYKRVGFSRQNFGASENPLRTTASDARCR